MTTAHAVLLGLIVPAYLLGSVPFGLLVAQTRGVDPRKAGSGNIGATNVGRLLGVQFFAIVFVLDFLKGLLPTLAAAAVLASSSSANRNRDAQDYLLWLLVGFAAVFGHMFSIFLKFQGGKGVATSTGLIFGVFPYYTLPGLVALLMWLVLFKVTRYVSVASMAGPIICPIVYAAIGSLWRWPIPT
jgi:glycerol-3-phosphate acyltransferase PlsY